MHGKNVGKKACKPLALFPLYILHACVKWCCHFWVALRCVYVYSFLLVCFCIIPDEKIMVFMASFREHGLPVCPKLHYVEDHMVPFIRNGKLGLVSLVSMVAKACMHNLIA